MKSQTGTVQTGLFGLMLPNKDSKRYLSKIKKNILESEDSIPTGTAHICKCTNKNKTK